ncbi:MAG: GNAT family N-acetyltransferase [Pseudomonadota bacterium]
MGRCIREEFVDKIGNQVVLECGPIVDDAPLGRMYEEFTPKGSAQGLPPTEQKARSEWVKRLARAGEHFLAWADDQVVGHACLIPDMHLRDAEFLIFVIPLWQNRGIGTRLSASAMAKARELGITIVWLTVAWTNFRAIKVYKKVGFEFCDDIGSERMMVVRL